MIVIPALDIRARKVVRLIQGDVGLETIYSDSPLDIAKRWAAYGVGLIHIVDLDGAMEGRPKNLDVVKEIAKSIKPKIELGGGIRDMATIKMVLNAGIDRVVVGTRALDGDFLLKIDENLRDKIVIGIDAKEGIIYTKGWLFKTKATAIELAKRVQALGFKTINYTDISRDGTLKGPNLNSLKELLKATKIDVIASGGISSIEDIKNLKELEKDGLKGVIIGKALYENKIDLKEAIEICANTNKIL